MTQPLNPRLYAWMKQRFQKVSISNQGSKPRWRIVDTGNAAYPLDVEVSDGHEQYRVICPICNYQSPTLCVSSLFLQLCDIGDKGVQRLHHFMNLACCFHCHAEDDLVDVSQRNVYSMGISRENHRVNALVNIFSSYFNVLSSKSRGQLPITIGLPAGPDELLAEPIPLPPMVPIHTLDCNHHVTKYLRGEGDGARKHSVDPAYLGEVYGVGYVEDWVFHDGNGESKVGMSHQRAYDRIVFPFYKDNKLVTWQGRICQVDDTRPRWLFPPGQGSHFFGWDYAKRYRYVILVEGAFDVIAAGPASIAICTSNLSLAKCIQIAKQWVYVIIAIDPSEFAHEVQRKDGRTHEGHAHVIKQRLQKAGAKPILLEWAGLDADPSDVGPREFRKILHRSLQAHPSHMDAVKEGHYGVS